jgi:hypothetical protein
MLEHTGSNMVLSGIAQAKDIFPKDPKPEARISEIRTWFKEKGVLSLEPVTLFAEQLERVSSAYCFPGYLRQSFSPEPFVSDYGATSRATCEPDQCQSRQVAYQEGQGDGSSSSNRPQAVACHLPSARTTFRVGRSCNDGAGFGGWWRDSVDEGRGCWNQCRHHRCGLGCAVYGRINSRRQVSHEYETWHANRVAI